MSKIMLVLDNSTDQDFLDKILQRLGFNVISMKKGVDLSEQLLDHFPEIVFASTLGRNEKILTALFRIKQARGKPKLVVLKQEKESAPLSEEQRKIIDGVLYSPIDPFKLIDLLTNLTGEDIVNLRRKYNEMLQKEKGEKPPDVDFGATRVVGKQVKAPATIYIPGEAPPERLGDEYIEESYPHAKPEEYYEEVKESRKDIPPEPTPVSQGVRNIISDEQRKKKYEKISAQLKRENTDIKVLDSKKLRALQKKQSEKIQESQQVKENRSHFLQTLFTMNPVGIKRK